MVDADGSLEVVLSAVSHSLNQSVHKKRASSLFVEGLDEEGQFLHAHCGPELGPNHHREEEQRTLYTRRRSHSRPN